MDKIKSFILELQKSRVDSLQWSHFYNNDAFSKSLLPDKGGIYLFVAEKNSFGKHLVLYAGKTDSLRRRFGEHILTGNKHIKNSRYFLFSIEPDESRRDFAEAALISVYNPPGNTQLRTAQ